MCTAVCMHVRVRVCTFQVLLLLLPVCFIQHCSSVLLLLDVTLSAPVVVTSCSSSSCVSLVLAVGTRSCLCCCCSLHFSLLLCTA